jgi:hypothetical protein
MAAAQSYGPPSKSVGNCVATLWDGGLLCNSVFAVKGDNAHYLEIEDDTDPNFIRISCNNPYDPREKTTGNYALICSPCDGGDCDTWLGVGHGGTVGLRYEMPAGDCTALSANQTALVDGTAQTGCFWSLPFRLDPAGNCVLGENGDAGSVVQFTAKGAPVAWLGPGPYSTSYLALWGAGASDLGTTDYGFLTDGVSETNINAPSGGVSSLNVAGTDNFGCNGTECFVNGLPLLVESTATFDDRIGSSASTSPSCTLYSSCFGTGATCTVTSGSSDSFGLLSIHTTVASQCNAAGELFYVSFSPLWSHTPTGNLYFQGDTDAGAGVPSIPNLYSVCSPTQLVAAPLANWTPNTLSTYTFGWHAAGIGGP